MLVERLLTLFSLGSFHSQPPEPVLRSYEVIFPFQALSQLSEAGGRERELQQQAASLQEQLSILGSQLESSRSSSSHLLEENEALREKLEDTRRDLKLSGDALTKTLFSCNSQAGALQAELAAANAGLEKERQARQALEGEAELARSRLAAALKEAELCLAAQSEAERALLREREEHQRLKDKVTGQKLDRL